MASSKLKNGFINGLPASLGTVAQQNYLLNSPLFRQARRRPLFPGGGGDLVPVGGGDLPPTPNPGGFGVIPGHNWTYGKPFGSNPLVAQNNSLASYSNSNFTGAPAPVDYVDADFTDVGAGTPPNVPGGTGGSKGLKGWFGGLGANSGWRLTSDPNSFGIGNTNGHAGLTIAGKNLAPISNVATGLYQGINALQGMSDVSKNENDRNALLSRIRASAAGNPMLSSYLTSDQMAQLNKIRRGYSDSTPSGNVDFGGLLGGAGKGALMGAAGGLPGMIIGAIGGGINAGINSKNQAIQNDTQNLEGLYQSLQDAEAQYKRMRTPNFTGLGLQSRYTNQWM